MVNKHIHTIQLYFFSELPSHHALFFSSEWDLKSYLIIP